MKVTSMAASAVVIVTGLGMSAPAAADQNAACRLSEGEETAIRTVMETYRTEWLKLDADGVIGLFTEDAVLSPNGKLEAVEGRAAARSHWFPEGVEPLPLTYFNLSVLSIEGCGGFAALRGVSDVGWEQDGFPGQAIGAYVTHLRKTGDGWRITLQMWDSAK